MALNAFPDGYTGLLHAAARYPVKISPLEGINILRQSSTTDVEDTIALHGIQAHQVVLPSRPPRMSEIHTGKMRLTSNRYTVPFFFSNFLQLTLL